MSEQGARTQKLELLRRLEKAARQCARRKRSRPDAIAFRTRQTEHLLDLCDRLLAGTWCPAPGLVFVTTRPKCREVHAARFFDRVVHHLICAHLAPELDRRLAPNVFACRPGKGTHAAMAALQAAMWRLSRRGKVRVWALKLDVVNFFHSIDRAKLCEILQRPLARAIADTSPPFDLRAAVAAILNDEPGLRSRRTGDRRFFDRVPQHKRLSAQGVGRGLPIGNLTSQWFANAYLDPLDQFVQRTLGIGNYFRYMDDFILLDCDPERLQRARQAIVVLLAERLDLSVHGAAAPQPVSEGVDFCGYIVRPAYALVRRRTVSAARERLRVAAQPLAPHVVPAGRSLFLTGWGRIEGPAAVWAIDGTAIGRLREAWSSTGHIGHGASRALLARAWRSCPALARHLRKRGRRLEIRTADEPAQRGARHWPSYRDQRAWLRRGAGAAVLLVQVGRTVELIRRRDARCLRVAWPLNARGPGVRRGYCGPWLAAALASGRTVALAAQMPGGLGRVANRAIRWLIAPLDHAASWWRQYTGAELDVAQPGRPQSPFMPKWLRRAGSRRARSARDDRRLGYAPPAIAPAASLPSVMAPVPQPCSPTGQYYLILQQPES